MQDKNFILKAEKAISHIYETIENHDLEGKIDIDFNNDVLTLDTDKGVFVINRQGIAKEIWLSSPISGPYHFANKNDRWVSKSGIDLFEVLEHELNIKIEKQPK